MNERVAEDSNHKTINVSSSSTVFLKYFLPTIWIVFFGTLMIVFLFADQFRAGTLSPMTFKVIYTTSFFLIVATMYFTIFKLKRVEFDEQFVYITNYIKIFRYPYENVEKITHAKYGIWLVMRVHLIKGGFFGKKSTFLGSKKKLAAFIEAQPERAAQLGLMDFQEEKIVD
ncbi:MAG: hypothetical protein ACPG19_15270 [Saprospiraceae bacterium]